MVQLARLPLATATRSRSSHSAPTMWPAVGTRCAACSTQHAELVGQTHVSTCASQHGRQANFHAPDQHMQCSRGLKCIGICIPCSMLSKAFVDIRV